LLDLHAGLITWWGQLEELLEMWVHTQSRMTTVRLFWPRVPGGASQAPSRSFDVAESSSSEPSMCTDRTNVFLLVCVTCRSTLPAGKTGYEFKQNTHRAALHLCLQVMHTQ
ncbi:hypothetical protein KUCAC02_022478, partial [Chaenocephalus aceratus]